MCPSSLGFIFTVRGCFNDHWSAKRSPLQADDGVIGAAAGRLAPSRLRACGCSRCSGLPAVRRFRLAPAAAVKRCLGAAAGSLACAVEQRAAASQLLLLACGHGSWPAGLGCMGVAAGRLADATEQRVDMAAGQLTANPPPSSSVWVRRLDGPPPPPTVWMRNQDGWPPPPPSGVWMRRLAPSSVWVWRLAGWPPPPSGVWMLRRLAGRPPLSTVVWVRPSAVW